ncbi:hypothetical protein MPSEU_000861700 [Mayamaea pseudoterrestris]|nr:hypothetical protein MPSEU_000861700 [Mayamaea pseudoterrestris]
MDDEDERESVASEQQQPGGRKRKTKTAPRRNKGTAAAVVDSTKEATTTNNKETTAATNVTKKPRKNNSNNNNHIRLNPTQQSVADQVRRVFEEDIYSASGSILHDAASSDEEDCYMYRGQRLRLDRAALQQSVRKFVAQQQYGAASDINAKRFGNGDGEEDYDSNASESGKEATNIRKQRGKIAPTNAKRKEDTRSVTLRSANALANKSKRDLDPLGLDDDADADRDGSIFGQTTGTSNSTWVECDKCKKWRRLRGVIDEKKLPPRWFCSMNKTDPERAKCSAPEEEYETSHTPESAADARIRKHLRIWVRRLQCNEAYETRQPTQTRLSKKRQVSSGKEPYEWVRCCNPSCGKWRATLRIMDAKSSVIDRTRNGEWYCVMNVWDEKTASCAAPQENLPPFNCPPWVMQDYL